jgi:predicted ester cyclase
MSIEENKAVANRLIEEVVNKGNLDAIDDLVDANYLWHGAPPGLVPGIEGLKKFFPTLHAGLPDWHDIIEDMIAEGDKVVVRITARGTHKGEFMGIAPTGKQVTITGILIYRIVAGKIVEEWFEHDMLGLMQQLGVIPSIGQAEQ